MVQFRGDLHRQAGVGQGLFRDLGIRGRPHEVAAHADEDADLAVPHGADGGHGVEAVRPGGEELELVVKPVMEVLRHLLENAHGPVALDVGVAADGADAGSGLADVALEKQDVDHVAEGGNRVLVLGQAHGPADDRGARGQEALASGLDLFQCQSGGFDDVVPFRLFEVPQVFVDANGVVLDELMVQHGGEAGGLAPLGFGFEKVFAKPLEEGLIAAGADLEEVVGQLCAHHHAGNVLRILEPQEPGFGKRIHGDDDGAVLLRLLQRAEHARVVGAGILTRHENQRRRLQVREADGAFADADRFDQGRAGRFVAHVGAVGQVVRPDAPNEELVGEGCLVRCPPGSVEDRLVGVLHVPDLLGDQLIGVVPLDGLVVGCAFVEEHRMRQPALLAQPVVVARLQVRNGVLREEFRRDAAERGFFGHRLGAVLAEFRSIALFVFGPGAAHAVKAVNLVDCQECLDAAQRAHLLKGNFQRVCNSRKADGSRFGLRQGQF